MALVYCPDCGKEVSDSAISCPNCAYPLSKLNTQISYQINPNNQLIIAGYVATFLSLLVLPIFFMLVGIVIGVINLTKGAIGHGILQIVLSLLFGIVGTFMGILSIFI